MRALYPEDISITEPVFARLMVKETPNQEFPYYVFLSKNRKDDKGGNVVTIGQWVNDKRIIPVMLNFEEAQIMHEHLQKKTFSPIAIRGLSESEFTSLKGLIEPSEECDVITVFVVDPARGEFSCHIASVDRNG